MRRVSYHQSVFDLLELRPSTSARARELIEAFEARSGRRLPEAIRQWYLIDGVVALDRGEGERSHLWYDYSNMDHPQPLADVLREMEEAYRRKRAPRRARVLVENQGVCSWFLQLNDSDDPPVVVDESYRYDEATKRGRVVRWVREADSFSDFLFDWIAGYYFRDWTPLSETHSPDGKRARPTGVKPYLNGLWLYAPRAEVLLPPYLDYLIEHFSEEGRQELGEGVMQYRFQGPHGRVRVTTDDPREADGVSAWWLHADSEEALFQLARQVWWCGNLPQALRHATKPARPVLDRLRQPDPA